MRRLRYAGKLFADLVGISRYTGAAWLLPVVLILMVSVALAVASQAAVPYLVYTFF